MKMNNKLEELKKLVIPIYNEITCWPHGWLHVRNVAQNAKILAQMEGEDIFLSEVAGYCHDLGRVEEEKRGLVNPEPGFMGHAGLSVRPTREILQKLDFNQNDIEIAVEAVAVHQQKKYEGNNKIALILQDADRKDGLGPWGIIRLASFNIQIADIEPPSNETESKQTLQNILDVVCKDEQKRQMMIRALRYTLEWYDSLLNTESAKGYLLQDRNFSENFLEKILKIK